MNVQRLLIALGLLILMAGIAWPILSRSGLGRLPGDVVIQLGGRKLYLPLATSVLLSLILSTLLWYFAR
jgi:TRAP-type uncharacterized transport system fused permease subunit